MINRINSKEVLNKTYTEVLQSTKGSRLSVAAFLLLFTSIVILGCESPGSVGDDLIQNEDTIEQTVVVLDDFNIINDNAFSGRLTHSALGYFEDPLYGTMQSTALFKPVISRAVVDTIHDETVIYLRLIFNSDVYGNENSVSSFEVYEAGEIWRGNQLRLNHEVKVDYSSKIAEFQVAQQDTIVIEMTKDWTEKFAGYFNSEAADRDSLYRTTFPGVAVVPSETNQKLRFIKHGRVEESDLITSFLVDTTSAQIVDDEDEETDEEDTAEPELVVLDVRDWGASFIRSNEPESSEGIVLHSSERALRFNIDLPLEALKTQNIVNAQLVLTKDTRQVNQSPGIVRPRINLARMHVFNKEPLDLMGEIFTTETPYMSNLNEDEETFKIDVTQFILNEVFGNVEGRLPYFSVQSINGIVYSANFYDSNGPDEYKPRIVITSLK